MNTLRQDDEFLIHTEELVAEWRGLQSRIDEIRQELGGVANIRNLATKGSYEQAVKGVKAVKAVKAETTKQPKVPQQDTGEKRKRGRPPGSKNKPKDGEQTVDAVGGDGDGDGDGKVIDLPGLIETIGQQVHKPLTVADFVTLVLESGYTTKAKDFSNIVYQSLHKLVKRGMFVRNGETRAYEYVPQNVPQKVA